MMDWVGRTGVNGATDRNGIQVNVATQAALLEDLATHLRAGQGFSLATLNLDHVVKLHRDAAFHRAYAAHSHVTADGNPIVWLSRLAGEDVGLIPGSELIAPVVALCAQMDVPVAFLGSTQETLACAAARLEEQYPGLRIVAQISPSGQFDPEGDEAAACLEELRASGARVCFLALGAPKQELLAARGQELLPGTGFISIGAGLDFIAGTQRRAPKLVRVLAAEWLWRLSHNPGRLAGRYAACFAILPALLQRALRARRQGRARA